MSKMNSEKNEPSRKVRRARLTPNDRLIIGIVREKGAIRSIKDLHKIAQETSNIKYGGVNYIVHKLDDNGTIILDEYFDPADGVTKTGVFSTEQAKTEFLKEFNQPQVVGNLNSTQLSELMQRTNLFELFAIIMREQLDQESEYTSAINELLKDPRLKRKKINIFDIQRFIITLIEEVMEIDLDFIMNLKDNNEDLEVFVGNG